MNLKILSVFILVALMPLSAMARPMITDLSDRKIKISAKFSGKEILLYGARVEAGDIVIVIRGPSDNYIVRKKENIHGVWVNTSSVEFNDIPQFYRIAASGRIDKEDTDIIRKNIGVGFDTIRLDGKRSSKDVEIAEFRKALTDKMVRDQLFDFEVINLPFLEGTLFRIRIDFPAKIREGIFTAEIYSFEDGQLLGMQSIPIEARKTGIEAFIYELAHSNPAIYGLCCIIVAVGTGLIAGRLFKKF